MWIPSHVGIIPNVIADNVTAQEQEATLEGMVTGLISKQERRNSRGTGEGKKNETEKGRDHLFGLISSRLPGRSARPWAG
eukprot:1812645-Pleurochrysis_carterae.AAC.6